MANLADSISSQFDIQQNNSTGIASIIDGQQSQWGVLGDMQFDNSAERRYVEEGYLQRDPFETDSKLQSILWQEPTATVLIKKRMFSSVAENYRPDFMDIDERLYYKAMCLLFQNKCAQVSALEKLGKIQQMTSATGSICNQLVPWIISLTDIVTNTAGLGNGASLFGGVASGSNPLTTQDATSFISVVNRLRVLNAYGQTNPYTTWIQDPTDLYQQIFGPGTGVIEITNFTNLNTTSSVNIASPGSFNISIADPYQSMVISEYDIEIALSDATNAYYNNKGFQFGVQSANQVISDQQNALNSMRNGRNASPITFTVEPNLLSGQQVTVVIDRLGLEIPFVYNSTGGTGIPGLGLLGIGNPVSVPPDYLFGGNLAGYDGLATTASPIGPNSNIVPLIPGNELSTFQAIIVAIYQQIALLKNTSTNQVVNNQYTNYARRKLRFNFAGKCIIQPMDVVHIYMNSKSQFDGKILAGLEQMYSGCGILQNLTSNINAVANSIDTLFNPAGNIALQAEKSIYVGPDFPNYLWSLVRTQFVTETEGTHVFAGLVEKAWGNWSNGNFKVDVNGPDNTAYFLQGMVNFKPGVDAFNGLIFDPLTPFQSNFDSITVNAVPTTLTLLDENKYLLSETAAGSLIKYKLGALAGEKATSGNYIQDQSFDPTTGNQTRVFYAPDGLAYKWKQGIGIFTQFGSSANINGPNLVGSPNIYAEPFAGLDVMNVLSLLITGIPYNYATFFKATSNLNGFSGDPNSGGNASNTFLGALQNDLTKRNTLWGDFIPFKSLIMSQAGVAQAMQGQLSESNADQALNSQLQTFQTLQNTITGLNAINAIALKKTNASDPAIAGQITTLQAQLSTLSTNINSKLTALQNSNSQFSAQTTNSASYATSALSNNGSTGSVNEQAQQIIRQEVNYLTRRMSYDVRANDDKNLFIVDDYYDTDYDIQAFSSQLTDGIKIYNNEYTNVSEKIRLTAQLLDLEVFSDSQGHIRCRPPQYNKMPSSVFYRMLYISRTTGVQIFPQFMNTLFTNALDTLRQNIEIIEDRIRLDCAILGHKASITSDIDAALFITVANVTAGQSTAFNFISDPTDTITDINTLVQQANPIAPAQSLSDFGVISAAGTSTKAPFGPTAQYSVLFQILQGQQLNQQVGFNASNISDISIFSTSVVQQLVSRIQFKSGQTLTSQDYLTASVPNQPLGVDAGQTIDVFKVTQELSTYMTQWQMAVQQFYLTIKNAQEFLSLQNNTSISNSIGTPGIFGNSQIPEVYQHMIENESYDDYGLGSGTRYVIHNSQIINLSLGEVAPPMTAVEVHGTLPFFAPGQGSTGLESFPGGGNAQVTAMAVDYDMWRTYGYKQAGSLTVPFLTDPSSQLGPYAAMVLAKNRADILQGTCTIAGNEYMQVGEVVLLEDRNLLFYITNVNHSMQQGGRFTTTLTLRYGHTAGDYIPTYLDTVGKLLYKNRDITTTIIQRQDNSGQEKSLGVVQLNGAQTSPNVLNTGNNQSINSYSSTNGEVINNVLYNTAFAINANGSSGNNILASVELRVYYDNASGGPNSSLLNYAAQVQNQLIGSSQGPQVSFSANQPTPNATLPTSAVSIVSVNMDDDTTRKSPSQQAISAARNQMAVSSTNSGASQFSSVASLGTNNNPLRTVLFANVIDCWLVYTVVPAKVASPATANPGI